MFSVPNWDDEQKDQKENKVKKKKELKGSFVLSPQFKAKLLNTQQAPCENKNNENELEISNKIPLSLKNKSNKKLRNLESKKIEQNQLQVKIKQGDPEKSDKKNKTRRNKNDLKSPKIVKSLPHMKNEINKMTVDEPKNSRDRITSIKKKNVEFKKKKLKDIFKNLLEKEGSNRRSLDVLDNSAKLRARMMDKLNAARFRYLNEKLYLTDGQEAQTMFKEDPDAFKIYHDGYRQQIKKWPINPLDVIVKDLKKMAKNAKVADLGCGEGMLAQQVTQTVRSFDLVSTKPHVEMCDMAHTPLLTAEMDVIVYCLALMGTNLKEFLVEANRILKIGGVMKIAEVESRFEDANSFISDVEKFGFQNIKVNDAHSVFYFFDFKKVRDLGKNRSRLPKLELKPCLYKKR